MGAGKTGGHGYVKFKVIIMIQVEMLMGQLGITSGEFQRKFWVKDTDLRSTGRLVKIRKECK